MFEERYRIEPHFNPLNDGTTSPEPSYHEPLEIAGRKPLSIEIREDIATRLYKNSLNEQQHVAVRHVIGPMLVLAGAGTGKTHVSIARIIELILGGVPPTKILAATFTNKAAGEMEERVDHVLGGDIRARPTVTTLHSLGVRILRNHAHEIGRSNTFEIIDVIDQDSYLDFALKKLPTATLDNITDKREQRDYLRDMISRCKNNLVSFKNAPEDIKDAYQAYEEEMKRDGVFDFDDLIYQSYRVFTEGKKNKITTDEWRSRYDFILVDEYQDTNLAQAGLLLRLCNDEQNIFVVGDDDQSIYGWRAADVSIIRNFSDMWKDAELVKLLITYRIPQPILDLSNKLMESDPDENRHQKKLISFHPEGAKPRIVEHHDSYGEAEWVVNEALRLNGTVAILFRYKRHMVPFISNFEERSIQDYEVWASEKFYLSEEKRNIQSLLKVIDDPSASDAALSKVLQMPQFCLPEKDYAKLLSRSGGKTHSLWEELDLIDLRKAHFTKAGREAYTRVKEYLKKYHKRHRSLGGKETLSGIAKDAIQELFPSITDSHLKSPPEDTRELAGWVAKQLSFIKWFAADNPEPTFRKYLGYKKMKQREHDKKATRDGIPEIVLSTIHAVKGLEFDHVFFVALDEETIPGKPADEPRINEERRVFYVAMTRPKKTLTLSYSNHQKKRGQRTATRTTSSRFLKECGAFKLARSTNKQQQVRLRNF